MVSFKSFITLAVLSGAVSALPRPQESVIPAEVPVAATDGTIVPIDSATSSVATDAAAVTDTALSADPALLATDAVLTSASITDSALLTAATDTLLSSVIDTAIAPIATVDTASLPIPPIATPPVGGAYGGSSPPTYGAPPTHGGSSPPTYGSGHSNWGGSGYDECVNQCIAQFGAPPASFAPTATGVSVGSVGTGATHTVIVAPTQGVLRYIPFTVNAAVGDTVMFMWGANNHTVTKGSALTPCNRSSDVDGVFASGLQNDGFVFTQVVNDTNPTYFYCAAPNHCQRGMFGIINPAIAAGAATSVGAMIPQLSANNSDVSAFSAYTSNVTSGNDQASSWGSNIDMAGLPEWAQPLVAENVMYTRSFLAANSETLKEDGSVDLSSAATTPLVIPQDISAPLNNAGAGGAAGTESGSTESAAAQPTDAAAATSGASSLTSSRIFVGVVVALVTFFTL